MQIWRTCQTKYDLTWGSEYCPLIFCADHVFLRKDQYRLFCDILNNFYGFYSEHIQCAYIKYMIILYKLCMLRDTCPVLICFNMFSIKIEKERSLIYIDYMLTSDLSRSYM